MKMDKFIRYCGNKYMVTSAELTPDGVSLSGRLVERGTEEKTVKEWLETLPEGYRERALRNYDPEFCDTGIPIIDLAEAVMWGFDWADSPGGYEFWNAVTDWAHGYGELPPLPEEER